MLKIQFKDGRADPVALVEPGKTIGKGGVNDIVVDEDGVTGFHADLKVDGNQVTLTDIGGGMTLNGDALSGPTVIRAGDNIGIKGVELEVIDDEGGGGAKTLVLSGTALLDMGAGAWSLVADSGPEKGQVIPVVDKIEIGRALECDISILEPGLSRKHAELELSGDDLYLRDLGSVNGTYVNGEKIVDDVKLKDGDRMQFEKIRFIVTGS